MYVIQKQPKLSAKKSIDRCTALGLGISVLQLVFSLYRLSQFGCKGDESVSFNNENLRSQSKGDGVEVICGVSTKAKDLQKISVVTTKSPLPAAIAQQELGRCFIAAVVLYGQLFLVIVDMYLYRFLLRATQKESTSDCWLGLYLQISLLTYDVAQILIVAHSGVFDGSSMLLAARATVRALSIDMIYLFLREIEEQQEADVFLYFLILNV